LLLAAPPLGDPNFNRSVVVLGSHGRDGSLGWVINGQQVAPVGQLLRDAGLTPEAMNLPNTPSYAASARVGGPVSPRSAWLLYERGPKWEHDSELALSDRWAVSGDRSLVESIARGEGPVTFRLVLGYAGWAPEQLDQEISVGAWMPVTFDDIVFAADDEDLWLRAYEHLIGVSPFAFTGLRPGSA
jgi:putative transcriptional regulator